MLTLLKVIVGVLFCLYPILIYLGLREYDTRVIAGALLVVALLRYIAVGKQPGFSLYWLLAVFFVAILGITSGSQYTLYLYPILINLILFIFFTVSLYRPPNVIEQIARRHDKEFNSSAIPYTHKVTLVWAIFFLLNGAASIFTMFISEYWWMLYNGLISYILIGVIFASEYVTRKCIRRKKVA